MHFPRSIRWRLQLWYGALVVALLSGFGMTAFRFERAGRLRQIDEALQERISILVDAMRSGPVRGPVKTRLPEPRLSPAQAALFGGKEGYYYLIWMQGAEPAFSSPGAPPHARKPRSGDPLVATRGYLRESHLFAAPVDSVLVGRSIAGEEADLQRLAGALAAIGGIVLAVGLVGGWWLAGRAIRPVDAISAAAARIAAGDLSQRISVSETDSELGRLAGLLNSTFARLEAAFAQQGRFTADAAHELRTPVSVILTQTQSALARERPVAEYRETLEACQRATQRMRRLIESLLELARLDAGQEPLRRDECDLARIAGDCVELIRPLANARFIKIDSKLSAAVCRADAERLGQVITNLLSNAIEYNHDRGEVHVATYSRKGMAVLTVTNTGPGIPPGELAHIFERFHRGDKARGAAGGHCGLGLAIAQAIARAHGGEIAAASEPNQGATFTVNLPA